MLEKRDKELTNLMLRERHRLSQEGKIDLSNTMVSNLSAIGTQIRLVSLILDNTHVFSLESLAPQPSLRLLSADNTQISSLVGLSRHPRLCSVSLRNTPVAEVDYFRLSCLALTNGRLSVINRKKVTNEEREAVSTYPIITKYLIEAGWDMSYPAPTLKEFKELAIMAGIRLKGVDRQFSNQESQKYFQFIKVAPIYNEGDSIFPRIEAENDNEHADDDYFLMMDVVDELRRIGIEFSPGLNTKESVYEAVRLLTESLKKLGTCTEKLN